MDRQARGNVEGERLANLQTSSHLHCSKSSMIVECYALGSGNKFYIRKFPKWYGSEFDFVTRPTKSSSNLHLVWYTLLGNISVLKIGRC